MLGVICHVCEVVGNLRGRYCALCVIVAVNSTHGQLDTCVELTHLPKSQLDTGVNSTHGQLDTRVKSVSKFQSSLTAQAKGEKPEQFVQL